MVRRLFPTPVRPEPAVKIHKSQVLLLSFALAAPLGACTQAEKAAPTAEAELPRSSEQSPAPSPELKLDESKLPGVNRFQPADLDTSKSPCADFGGYVNGKWLGANKIPGDRTSWGAFEMLDERSTAVQKQLAQRAAEMPHATGVEKIIGDFYATGMDSARINAQGLSPLKAELETISQL